jgi:hypothetical protein
LGLKVIAWQARSASKDGRVVLSAGDRMWIGGNTTPARTARERNRKCRESDALVRDLCKQNQQNDCPKLPEVVASEVRSQKSEVRSQKSELRNQKSAAHAPLPLSDPNPPPAAEPRSAARRGSAAKANGAAPPGKPNPTPLAIKAFCEEYKAARGWNPLIAPKDKTGLGKCYADAADEDEFRRILRFFFALDEDWVKETSYSAGAFVAGFGRIGSRVRGRAQYAATRVEVPPPPRLAHKPRSDTPPPLPPSTPPDPALEAERNAFVESLFAGGGKL